MHLPAYEDGTECSETSAYKIQTPKNYPEESVQHSEHVESLKSSLILVMNCIFGFVCYCNLWIARIGLNSECKNMHCLSNLIFMIKICQWKRR